MYDESFYSFMGDITLGVYIYLYVIEPWEASTIYRVISTQN